MEKIALTQGDWNRLFLWALTGGALGAGTGSLMGLAGQLRGQAEDAQDSENQRDDNVLYVSRHKKASNEETGYSLLGGPLAATGGVLSFLGALKLVREVQQKQRIQDLQAALDAEQQLLLAPDPDRSKAANTPPVADPGMGFGEKFWTLPVAAALLTAIASGVITNKTLGNIFPPVNDDYVEDGPPEVVVRDQEKTSSFRPDPFVLALEVATEALKQAGDCSQSYLADVVASVASGNLDNLEGAVARGGARELLKEASGAATKHPVENWRVKLAYSAIAQSPSLKFPVASLMAGELSEFLPMHYKLACDLQRLDPALADKVEDLAVVSNMAFQAEEMITKTAALVKELPATSMPLEEFRKFLSPGVRLGGNGADQQLNEIFFPSKDKTDNDVLQPEVQQLQASSEETGEK